MTNYGPPLRFKAVYTKTGEEILLDFDFRKNMSNWEGVGEKDAVYQSTGHTDANGVEVFFGDVLTDQNGKVYEMQTSSQCKPMLYPKQEPFLIVSSFFFNDYRVIGNAHTPQAELQRRAEGVRNG